VGWEFFELKCLGFRGYFRGKGSIFQEKMCVGVNVPGELSWVDPDYCNIRSLYMQLAWLNPVVIPSLLAGTCAVLRGSSLIVLIVQVRLTFVK